jgi:tyrosyl-tRNA synthetase
VARSHGEEAARRAEEHFTRVVREGQAPEDVPETQITSGDVHLPAVLAGVFGNSRSYWRRLIKQGAVRIDGVPAAKFDFDATELAGKVIQGGRRQFVRVRLISGT